MVLDPNKLKTEYLNLLEAKAETAEEAAQAWVDAYETYALDATAIGFSPPNITPASKQAMKATLQAYFANVDVANPAGAASTIASALSVFWLTPPVVFSPPAPPLPFVAVTGVIGTPALQASLQAIFAVVGGTEDSKATAISGAMDIFTKLVQVTLLNPPAPPIIGFLL